jgi:chromosome segregation ATPase
MTPQCPHGQLRRTCDLCELTQALETAQARIAELERELDEARAEVNRLNDWADSMTDIAMRERSTGDAVQKELRAENTALLDKQRDLLGQIERMAGEAFARGPVEGRDIYEWVAEWSTEKQARESAEARLARLRGAVEKAPHGIGCQHSYRSGSTAGQFSAWSCTCWKAALTDSEVGK